MTIVTRAVKATGRVLARVLFRDAVNRKMQRESGLPRWPRLRRSDDRPPPPNPGPD